MFGIARPLAFALALAGLAAGPATAGIEYPGQTADDLITVHTALRAAATHPGAPGDGPTIIIVQHQDSQVIPDYGCAVNCRSALPANREVNDRSLDRAHLFSQRAFDQNNPRAFFFFNR